MRLIRGRGLLAKRTVGVLRMLLRARLARLLLWPSLLLLPGLLLWPGLLLRTWLLLRPGRPLLMPGLLLWPESLLLWPGLLWGPGRLSRRLLRWIRLVEPLLRPRYLLTGYLLLGLL